MNVLRVLKELSPYFINLGENSLIYGPQGKMLIRNLEEHWFLHSVTMSHYNVFLSEEFNSTINLITNSLISNMPFGLATIKKSKNSWNQNIIPTEYKINCHDTAEVTIFNDNTEAKNMYHQIQKERKIWWRKLAQYPSRFKLTEAKKIKNVDQVDIEAQFSFGNILVERIAYHTDVQKLFSQIDNKKNFIDVQKVEHVVSLDWGCLALLCDASDMDKTRKLHIHSKLAPHKVAFHVKTLNNEVNIENNDLNRFVFYLNNMLRAKGLNTILTSSEEVIDKCLVPFVVSIDRTSLENGIIHITNRSTTLKEAVHITDLVKYLRMRC